EMPARRIERMQPLLRRRIVSQQAHQPAGAQVLSDNECWSQDDATAGNRRGAQHIGEAGGPRFLDCLPTIVDRIVAVGGIVAAWPNSHPTYVMKFITGDFYGWNMKKGDVICPDCAAGYRRIELETRSGKPGHYKCLVCDRILEVFDG